MSKAEDYTHIGATNDIKELGNGPWDKGYQPSGISKAEERAMQAYPNMTFPFTPLDLNAYRRGAFINGYEQAEKDLALTWEDVKRIVEIADKLCPYTSKDIAEFQENFQTEEAYYKKVLELFNDGGKENTERD